MEDRTQSIIGLQGPLGQHDRTSFHLQPGLSWLNDVGVTELQKAAVLSPEIDQMGHLGALLDAPSLSDPLAKEDHERAERATASQMRPLPVQH